jgi:GcrA cell cycle regulator
MSANIGWTKDREDHLLALRETGMSASQVGLALGASKNACLARATKLGKPFPKRMPDERTGAAHSLRQFRAPKFSSIPLPEAGAMPFDPLLISLIDLEPHHCREVVSPDGAQALFCGHNKISSSSYCEHHHAINWQPAPSKKPSLYRFGAKAA